MRLKPTSCPVCSYQIDAHTGVLNKKDLPARDDVSVCMKCSALLIFDKDLNLKTLTDEQLIAVMMEHSTWTKIQRTRDAVRKINWDK